jgi:predicted dinucleotide-binding enzyme
MKIGILGAGQVGQSFAKALLPLGHHLMLSSRTPDSDKMQTLSADLGEAVQVGTVAETIAFADTLAVALSWDAVPDIVDQGDWTGKVVIDMTNRFGGVHTSSAAQDMARMLHGAHVVKAFNTIGAEHYQDPIIAGQDVSMLIAGNDDNAKQRVLDLAAEMGFAPVDAGDLAAAAHLESLAALWVHLAFRKGYGRNIGFKLLGLS